MDAVNVFLSCVVGFSVILFLMVDSYEESRRRSHKKDQISQSNDSEIILESVKADNDRVVSENCDGEEEEAAAADDDRVNAGDVEEEAEDPVNAGSERYGSVSEICDGEVEEADSREVDEGEEESSDDWEGIEQTELEKAFGEAMALVSEKMSNGDLINQDLITKLHGLQKVALEGRCQSSQPTIFNVAARAKWNDWKKSGKMSREMAMEKYIKALEAIPGWKGYNPGQEIQRTK